MLLKKNKKKKKKKKKERKKMKDFLSQEQTADIFQVGKKKKMARQANGNLLTCYEAENSRKSRYH